MVGKRLLLHLHHSLLSFLVSIIVNHTLPSTNKAIISILLLVQVWPVIAIAGAIASDINFGHMSTHASTIAAFSA